MAWSEAGHLRDGTTRLHRDAARIQDLVPGGVDYVFQALGHAATIQLALRLSAPGGTTVLIGLTEPEARLAPDPLAFTFEERTPVGCMYGSCVPGRDYPMLFELVRSDRLRLDALVSATCRLDEVNQAFARMARGEGARTLIVYG